MMKKILSSLLTLGLLCALATSCTPGEPQSQTGTVNLDLTALSSTIMIAEVNKMKSNPFDYMKKTVKVNGFYLAQKVEETGKYYHYIVVDNCCLSLEFVWNGDHTYPDDYPEDRTPIELTGEYGSYKEADQAFYCLKVDEITITH